MVKTNHNGATTKIALIQQDIGTIKEKIHELGSKFDGFIENAGEKFACKSVEKKVDEHGKAIQNINLKLAKWGGIITAVFIIIQLFIKYFDKIR